LKPKVPLLRYAVSKSISWRGVGGDRELQVPRLPPDLLSDFVVSAKIMRLSVKKAAHVAVDECSAVGNPEFAANDKLETVR
jgi:hypothetical protein